MDEVRRGTRFRAFPGRKVRYGAGPWIDNPVYVVTRVRTTAAVKIVYYRCEASPGVKAEAYDTLPYLRNHGLEILK